MDRPDDKLAAMSPAPRWPVVLFDFDGTLLNTIDGIVASYIYTWQSEVEARLSFLLGDPRRWTAAPWRGSSPTRIPRTPPSSRASTGATTW